MPWRIVEDPAADFVETHYMGVLSPAELMAAANATLQLAKARGVKLFLGDCTQLVGGHSIIDLYALAELLRSLGFPPGGREAVLVPSRESAARNVDFWRATGKNQGLEIRVFEERGAALAWLRAPGDAPLAPAADRRG